MSTIYPKPNGRYYINYIDENGDRQRKPLIPPGYKYATKNKAIAIRLQKKFEKQKKLLVTEDVTLDTLLIEFESVNAIQGSKDQARRNSNCVKRFLSESNITCFSSINKNELLNWLSRQQVTNKTLHNYLSAVKVFWNYLNEKGLLGPVPVIKLAKKEKLPPRHFTSKERKLLFRSAIENNCFLEILLPMYTGVRLAELRLMEWEDFDFERKLLKIPKSKSKRPRNIPLSSRLIKRLNPRIGLIFPARPGFKYRALHTFINRIKPVAQQLPIFTQDMAKRAVGRKFHLLRHDFAVRAAKAGVPIPELQNWMGHESIATTMIYAQYAPYQYSKHIEKI